MKKITPKQYSSAKRDSSVRCIDYEELEECQCDRYEKILRKIMKETNEHNIIRIVEKGLGIK